MAKKVTRRKRKSDGVISIVEDAMGRVAHDIEEFIHPYKPKSPSKLTVIFFGGNNMSKLAKVQLAWTPSVSPDVTGQVLTVVVGGNDPVVSSLAASVATAGTFDVPQNTSVHVELVAVDTVGSSDVTTLDFQIGSLLVPDAPTGLGYSVVSITDVPDAATPVVDAAPVVDAPAVDATPAVVVDATPAVVAPAVS